MNPNRQNNRCVVPVGSGCAGCPGGRPVAVSGCATAGGIVGVANDCCNPCGVVNAANDCCNPCDGVSGGIIIGQSGSACNRETVLAGMPLAMAYVPWQSYCNIYALQQALRNGTMFRELDLEFAGRRCN